MGITIQSLHGLNRAINSHFPDTSVVDLLELGIQEAVDSNALGFHYLRDFAGNRFKSYISLDLHPVKGVTVFDLSVQNPNAFKVDVVTNIGTSEHVEYEQGQYNCWYNIHNWLKVGGIMITEVPERGSWRGHCRYYSTPEFYRYFQNLGYEIVELGVHNHRDNGNQNWSVLKKVKNENFMNIETFFSLMYMEKSASMAGINPLNNPKNLK